MLFCNKDDCYSTDIHAFGLCKTHYQQKNRKQKKKKETRICSVENCNEILECKGFCNKHYLMYRKTGSPVAEKDRPLKELLDQRYVVNESGCWIWIGGTNSKGYGIFRTKLAHRLMYEIYIGPFPDWMYICHTCDITLCVNPNHLFLGDQKDNMSDASNKGRVRNQYMDTEA